MFDVFLKYSDDDTSERNGAHQPYKSQEFSPDRDGKKDEDWRQIHLGSYDFGNDEHVFDNLNYKVNSRNN